MKLLLLTGATGFLGGAVLDKLLDNCNNINLLLLVRAPTPQAGQKICVNLMFVRKGCMH